MKRKIISLTMASLMMISVVPYNIHGASSYDKKSTNYIDKEMFSDSDREIKYTKPNVVRTFPNKDDQFVDKSDLYRDFPNDESGNYLTVEFNNINNDLRVLGDEDRVNVDLDFEFYKNIDSDDKTKLIDEDREVIFEGFKNKADVRESIVTTSSEVVDKIHNEYSSAKLYIDDDKYQENDTIKITLFDYDLSSDQLVEVTRGSETKKITLKSKGFGKFEGEVDVWKPFNEANENNIEVKYTDRNSATGDIEKVITKEAEIRENVEYRRKAQVYIEKGLYEKDERVYITVVDEDKNKSSKRRDGFYVDVNYNIDSEDDQEKDHTRVWLRETEKNTGIFEGSTKELNGKFEVIHNYREKSDLSIRGRAKIHIPITNELEDGIDYKAAIPKELVFYDEVIDSNKKYNDRYEWSFKTSVASNTDKSFQGSVPKDYDEDYPIVLKGENYNKHTEVWFRDASGYDHKAGTELSEGRTDILNVYLPHGRRGRDRLDVGLYDIIIQNNKDGRETINYGVFSVVSKGDYVPNEDFNQTDNDSIGGVIEQGSLKKYIKTSNDTLELKKEYIDNSNLSFDLDEIMGEDVWSRNIGYEGRKGSTINKLIIESKWSNITLSDVTIDSNSSNKNILIRTGRTAPAVQDNIKKKIRGNSIKSEFIEVGGNNYRADKLNLSIPFIQSNGKNLKLLKYDEDARRITEIKLTNKNINNVDKRINVELTNALPSDKVTKGIFVVVE